MEILGHVEQCVTDERWVITQPIIFGIGVLYRCMFG